MAADTVPGLLDSVRPATEEELKAQREGFAKYTPGPRQAKLIQPGPADPPPMRQAGGGNKCDKGKTRMELFPAEVLARLVLTAKHTGKVESPEAHFLKFAAGEGQDHLVYALLALSRELYPDGGDGAMWDLVHDISVILTFGAVKYGDHNWRRGMLWSRLIGAGLRHMAAHRGGDTLDDETGKPHLWHFGCCVVFLLSFAIDGNGTDDRYRPETVAVDDA